MERLLADRDRHLVGWEEILEGGLAPNAIVMSWRGAKGGIAATRQGHSVVMAPHRDCYLNYCQGDPALEPVRPPPNPIEDRILRLRRCYDFDPIPAGVEARYVLGAQACLWTEFISHPRHAHYMLWPRTLALAEIFWSPREHRDWADFVPRLEHHLERLEARGVKYARSAYTPVAELQDDGNARTVTLSTEISGVDLHFTFDGSDPDQHYPRYTSPLVVPIGATELRVAPFRNGRAIAAQLNITVTELEARAQRVREFARLPADFDHSAHA